jgi:hypothetical protein
VQQKFADVEQASVDTARAGGDCLLAHRHACERDDTERALVGVALRRVGDAQ